MNEVTRRVIIEDVAVFFFFCFCFNRDSAIVESAKKKTRQEKHSSVCAARLHITDQTFSKDCNSLSAFHASFD